MERINEDFQNERTWAMFCHLSAFAGFLIPFGSLIGPIIVWSIKKDQYPLVDDQGKESVNFQISILLYYIVSAILILILIGFALFVALFFFRLIITVVAAIKAYEGVRFRYPLSIRFIN
ncbi:MAG: DUF4870 domain-containing protein [Bacteroidales bacterium]